MSIPRMLPTAALRIAMAYSGPPGRARSGRSRRRQPSEISAEGVRTGERGEEQDDAHRGEPCGDTVEDRRFGAACSRHLRRDPRADDAREERAEDAEDGGGRAEIGPLQNAIVDRLVRAYRQGDERKEHRGHEARERADKYGAPAEVPARPVASHP